MFWSCSRKGWDALGDKSAKRPSSAQLSEVAVFAGYKVTFRIDNRPFYRYGGHSELIRFKEYYGMPRGGGGGGYEQDRICSLSIYARFSGQFFFKFS